MIIGFAGPKRSGKDYAYSIIEKHFYNVMRVAFADPIKGKICEIFGINREELEKLKTKEDLFICSPCDGDGGDIGYYGNFSGRKLLTGIGMLMRSYNEHQFEDYVANIVNYGDPDKLYICTDVRFQSEVDLIHSLEGVVVQIQRDGVEYEGTETERGIKGYDYIIKNDFNYEQNLITLVDRIILDSLNKVNKELKEL